MFDLDQRLRDDSVVVGYFPLCVLLMSRDANYPWFILVPQRRGVTEIFQLDEEDERQLMLESRTLSTTLMDFFNGDKLNVAALGNMVPQLHLHHIVRYRGDPAWPGPVWGAKPAKAFTELEMKRRVAGVAASLGAEFTPAAQK